MNGQISDKNALTGVFSDLNFLAGAISDPSSLQGTIQDPSSISSIYYDTTEHWNAVPEFIPKKGSIVIYSDYVGLDGEEIPNIKIGDGTTYLVDLPYISNDLREAILNHVNDATIHITAAERDSWNNKVTCYTQLMQQNEYSLIFSKR